MYLTLQEEVFCLSRENNEQSELQRPSKSAVTFTRSLDVSRSTSNGTLPSRACLVYHNKQYAMNHKLLLYPNVASEYLVRGKEAVDSKHYIAVPGRRYL